MHRPHLLWLAIILTLLCVRAVAQVESDPCLILTNGEKGSINARTTREDLVRLYGAANVVAHEVGLGEGDTEMGTVLFPNDPKSRIEISWLDHDKKTNPTGVTISGKVSRWHAVHDISLGTTYSELERLNGKPFSISGGTDQGNVVLSWNGGLLERELKDRGVVFIWFDNTVSNTRSESSGTDGRVLKSTKKRQERSVNRVSWKFPQVVSDKSRTGGDARLSIINRSTPPMVVK